MVNFLIKHPDKKLVSTKVQPQNRWLKLLKFPSNSKQKEKTLTPSNDSLILGVGTQLLINCKLGTTPDPVEDFIKDFLRILCESKKESEQHIGAQIITEHCYSELDAGYVMRKINYERESQNNELVRWPM